MSGIMDNKKARSDGPAPKTTSDRSSISFNRAQTMPVRPAKKVKMVRGNPFFKGHDGKWKQCEFRLGNPALRYFVRPAGTIEGHHGNEWHHKLNRFLHHSRTHLVLNILLIIDVLLIIAAIEVEVAFKSSEIHDLEKACEEAIGDASFHCPSHPGDSRLEDAVRAIEYTSVAVLSVFAVDNILLLLANGLEYFKNPLYVIDAIVVALAIVFETALRDSFAASIIIVGRAWRFVRIGHGVYETTHPEETEADKGEIKDPEMDKKELRRLSIQ
mmetsp:Transcript_10548/g.15736  ORF Transcript_10548/g.15736 Transcript_10548/m.15736 type:complete len:271 (-) Transcript_10548:147-959(-)